MPYKDLEKVKEYKKKYNKRYYQKNKEEQKKRVKIRRKKIMQLYYEYKKTLKCELCGDDRHYVLQFHHKNKIKDDELHIPHLAHYGYSFDRIVSEIEERCMILCANCHLEIHHMGM